jgi:thioredoxin-like negative regulator of GroEL
VSITCRRRLLSPFLRTAALAAAAVLGLLAARPAAAQDIGLTPGTVPPEVTLEDLQGNDVALSRWVGRRPVLIEFWAHWCEQCEALQPKLDAAARRYAGRADIVIVAVGVNQTRRSVIRHTSRHALPGTVLFDGAGRAVRAYRAPTTSYVVVLDARGRVVYTGAGADQDLDAALARATAAPR